MVMAVQPSHQTGTMRTANRCVRHRRVKTCPLPGENIERRRANVRIAVAAERRGPLHIGENVENVWTAVWRLFFGAQQFYSAQPKRGNSCSGLHELSTGDILVGGKLTSRSW